jgi:hypothetical protein
MERRHCRHAGKVGDAGERVEPCNVFLAEAIHVPEFVIRDPSQKTSTQNPIVRIEVDLIGHLAPEA